jgi:hypothetical protein
MPPPACLLVCLYGSRLPSACRAFACLRSAPVQAKSPPTPTLPPSTHTHTHIHTHTHTHKARVRWPGRTTALVELRTPDGRTTPLSILAADVVHVGGGPSGDPFRLITDLPRLRNDVMTGLIAPALAQAALARQVRVRGGGGGGLVVCVSAWALVLLRSLVAWLWLPSCLTNTHTCLCQPPSASARRRSPARRRGPPRSRSRSSSSSSSSAGSPSTTTAPVCGLVCVGGWVGVLGCGCRLA